MSHEWKAVLKNFEAEKNVWISKREEVFEHPLKPSTITIQESKIKRRYGGSNANSNSSSVAGTPKKGLSDPLSNFHPLSIALDGMDPLSQFAAGLDPLSQMAQEHEKAKEITASRKCRLDDSFEPWSSKKVAILNKFTTSEKLSIATSFLSGGEKVIGKPTTTVSDKVKTRLEQLDDFEEGSVKEMMNLTQQEYVNRIEELNQALRESWEQDQRVKALKIGIQSAKLLVDTAAIQFYPSKFVLITDILDNFGNLVYQRIHSKAEHQKPGSRISIPLPEQFTPDQVPESAKETCRNWFFKIASIRELIPRFYMETAILKSYSFLTQSEYSKALVRLTKMIRGIGDPLAAAYARCYLCRVGMSVAPEAHEHLRENFWDFLLMYHQLQSKFVKDTLTKQNLDLPVYLTLYPPALDWILQCVAYKASETILSQVLHKSKSQCNSALLLNSVMAAFKPEFIAKRATELVEIMKECDDSGFPKHLLFRTLGLCLISASPPENERLQLLNDVWKIVTKLKNPADYMSCAEVWIEYAVKHFTKREVNTFLGDIIRHMLPDRSFEHHYPQLTKVIDRILFHMHDFSIVFSMDKFLPFLDMLQKDSVKVDICKVIMEAFMRYQQDATSDPVIINAAMFICKTIHDSVNALTLEDERRQIGILICAFIRKISFGRDFEQQLGFYVEARATFSNLDLALIQLVQCVNLLAMKTRQIVKGHHTRKTSAFVKACIAFCFITIPSLMDVLSRLDLYLLSAQVALLNQSLSQADAFLKSAISLIPDTPATIEVDSKYKSTEPFLVSYISNLLSTLLIVPDHPEQEPLYLIRGLLNVIQDYTWEVHTDAKINVYLNVLNLLSALSQESYIWSIDGVDSNDALYGSDPKFLAEINKICSTLIDEILSHLKHLGDRGNFKKQSHLALELLCHIVSHGDLSSSSLFTLCNNLWLLAHRHGHCETKFAENSLSYIKMRGLCLGGSYQELAVKLQVPSQV